MSAAPEQEDDVVPGARVLAVLAGVVVVGALLILWAWATLRAREHHLRPSGAFPEAHLGPPRTVSGVREHMFSAQREADAARARARAELGRYAWVDRARGEIAIPIERAMELVAAGGGP
jgi:hypothetical protein